MPFGYSPELQAYNTGLGGALGQRKAQLGEVMGILQLQGALMQQQQGEVVRNILQRSTSLEAAIPELMRAGPLGIQAAQRLSSIQENQSQAPLRAAQTAEALRRSRDLATQGAARGQLAGLLSTGGFMGNAENPSVSPPTGIMMDENAARQAAMSADAAGQPVSINVPNPRNVQALSVLADPSHAIPELLRGNRPQNVSPLARLIAERDALPTGDPRRAAYDDAITKQSTHQAPVNIYSGSLTAGVDDKGNPVFVQPSGRPDTPPRVVTGVRPPPPPADKRAERELVETATTIESVRARVSRMSSLIQQNQAVVGPAGMARRYGEAAMGIVPGAGNMPTPALDYENEKNLMIADVRKLIEKDPNLSNQERETLSRTLGGGTLQTPGSAVRTLNNVLNFIEGKKLRGLPRAPAVGTIDQGYRFKGGNPADRGNWESVNP